MASEKTEKLGRVTGSSMVEIRDVTVASDIFSFFTFWNTHIINNTNITYHNITNNTNITYNNITNNTDITYNTNSTYSKITIIYP